MIGRTQVLAWWTRLRSTYWFVPSLMTVTAIALGVVAVDLDRRADAGASWVGWVYGGGAEGARALLTAVAGSAITVVSLTFSLTVVALTVASQHFGPRLLSNFMRDTAAQAVLGMFVGTFAFCLVVLRTVRGDGDAADGFVPHLSVTLAVGLALVSVAALTYYLHHIAASMQVSRIAMNVSRDLEAAIDRLYPDDAGGAEPVAVPPPSLPADGEPVHARAAGYVQAIDLEAVVSLAERLATTIWLRTRPGDFVVDGTELARLAPGRAGVEDCADDVRRAFVLGEDRTSWQDAEFAVQQLVEVALRALSPGVNEPFTAITCIDRLGQGLGRLLARRMPPAVLRGRHEGRAQGQVVAEPRTFASLLATAFDPVALYADANPAIYGRLLQALHGLGQRAVRAADRDAIEAQAGMTLELALRKVGDERHRVALAALHASLRADERRPADDGDR